MLRGPLHLLPLLAVVFLLAPSPLWPHGGGLDKYGCHHNRTHGGYHCHRGPFRGSMFDSQAEMLRQLEATSPAEMQEFSGRVVGVTDGDTITVLHEGVGEKIRLAGIDCPERGQDYGTRAKQFMSALVFRKTVRVYDQGRDRYERTIGTVLLPDDTNVNYLLVKSGMCWWYRKYEPDNGTLEQLEHEARAAQRGLWADPHAVPPWEWRVMRKRYR